MTVSPVKSCTSTLFKQSPKAKVFWKLKSDFIKVLNNFSYGPQISEDWPRTISLRAMVPQLMSVLLFDKKKYFEPGLFESIQIIKF